MDIGCSAACVHFFINWFFTELNDSCSEYVSILFHKLFKAAARNITGIMNAYHLGDWPYPCISIRKGTQKQMSIYWYFGHRPFSKLTVNLHPVIVVSSLSILKRPVAKIWIYVFVLSLLSWLIYEDKVNRPNDIHYINIISCIINTNVFEKYKIKLKKHFLEGEFKVPTSNGLTCLKMKLNTHNVV